MRTQEHWTDRLSQYMDGELSAAERAACEAHLSECGDCAGTLEDLRAILAQTSLLPDTVPDRDLWPGIEGRLEPRAVVADADVVPIASRRRITVTVPQLAAAAIALVLLTAGAARLVLSLPEDGGVVATGGPGATGVEPAQPGAEGAAPPVVFLAAYEPAVSELEAAFAARRSELDPETVRVVENNLAIIDRAIAEANEALGADPSSAFLTTHIAGAMRQKVDLLRRVTSIGQTES